jgi:predicted HTH domain antitoxin
MGATAAKIPMAEVAALRAGPKGSARCIMARARGKKAQTEEEGIMDVTLRIPDDIAAQLQAVGGDLSRRMLEDLAIEWYRREEVSLGQLAESLDLSINDANGLLKERGVFDDFSLEELDEQSRVLER